MKATHIHIQSENTTLAWLRLNIGIKKICLRFRAVQRPPGPPQASNYLWNSIHSATRANTFNDFLRGSRSTSLPGPPKSLIFLTHSNDSLPHTEVHPSWGQWFSTPYWGASLRIILKKYDPTLFESSFFLRNMASLSNYSIFLAQAVIKISKLSRMTVDIHGKSSYHTSN